MRHLLTVILGLAVLVATVAGCGGAHRYDSRLAAADSLMRPDPDSALAIVKAVDRDSLATEGDRAYRDLLLTQARYRCYEAATSDSDINRALAWYRAHSVEREKLTRALIYTKIKQILLLDFLCDSTIFVYDYNFQQHISIFDAFQIESIILTK